MYVRQSRPVPKLSASFESAPSAAREPAQPGAARPHAPAAPATHARPRTRGHARSVHARSVLARSVHARFWCTRARCSSARPTLAPLPSPPRGRAPMGRAPRGQRRPRATAAAEAGTSASVATVKVLMAMVPRDENGGGLGSEAQSCDMALRGVSLLPVTRGERAVARIFWAGVTRRRERAPVVAIPRLGHLGHAGCTLVTLELADGRCADRTSRGLEPVQPSASGIKARMDARGSGWWAAVVSSGLRVRTGRGERARARRDEHPHIFVTTQTWHQLEFCEHVDLS